MSGETRKKQGRSKPKWMYARDGVQHGPFTSKDLQALANRRELLPTDLIWKEGMKDWVRADKSSVVFPLSDADPPITTPHDMVGSPSNESDLAEFLSGKASGVTSRPPVGSQFDFLDQKRADPVSGPRTTASSPSATHGSVSDASLQSQTKFAVEPGEQLILQHFCAWAEGIATHSGTVYLTTHRIVFCQPDGFDAGMLVIHTFNLLTKTHDAIAWQVLLSDLSSVHRKKHLGFGRKTVVTARGGTTYALVVDGDRWRSAWLTLGITLTDSTGDASPKPATEQKDMETWHLNIKGKDYGRTVSRAELESLCQSGDVSGDDLIWKDGMEKWESASSIPGLIPSYRKPQGPPPVTEVQRSTNESNFESLVIQTVQTARKGATRLSHAKHVKGFHPQRLIAGIASGLGGLGTFLPWAHVPIIGTIDGTVNGDGWFTLALYVATIVCVLRKPHGEMLAGKARIVAGVCPIVASLIGFATISRVSAFQSEVDPDNPFMGAIVVRTGFGLYLVVLCGIAAALAVFALPKDKRRD